MERGKKELGIELKWNSSIGSEEKSVGESLLVKGVLVDASINSNRWSVDEAELPTMTKSAVGAQVRLDHSKSVRDIVGGVTKAEYDASNKRILFEAEIDSPEIIRTILKKRVKFVSIGAEADSFCSICHKTTRPFRTCKCDGAHDVIRNVKLKEISIISEPAYTSTEFTPVSFVSSVESALQLQESNQGQSAQISLEKVDEVKNKEEEEKLPEADKKETKETEKSKEEVKAEETVQKPAGPDSVVLLGKKMEELAQKMEEMIKGFGSTKVAPPETHQKSEQKPCPPMEKEEDEGKLRKIVREEILKIKKEEDEAAKVKVKKEQPPVPEEDEEDEEKTKKKEEDEEEEASEKPSEKIVRGAKVEADEGTSTTVTAENIPKWWEEVRAAAKKQGLIY